MMSSCLMLVFVVLLPAATYVGRYHIMVIIILGAAMLGIHTYMYIIMALSYFHIIVTIDVNASVVVETNHLLSFW
jgi:hypothetical protein